MHKQYKKISSIIFVCISISIWALLIWEHYHGGVPSHSFMARKDMPSISNWWGGLLLPLLTYLSLLRVQKRLSVVNEHSIKYAKYLQSVFLLCLIGLIYSGSMAYCFATNKSDINTILFQCLFLGALILPLYRAEFFLGFVIGMTYTFGAILPTFIASILAIISYIFHQFIYPFVLKIMKKNPK